MLEELSRCTEKFLEEASKYGEVSYSIAPLFYCFRWKTGMLGHGDRAR